MSGGGSGAWGVACATVAGVMGTFYLIGSLLRNHGLVDVAWGLGIGLIAGRLLVGMQEPGSLQVVLSVLVLLWSLRLSTYLFLRNWGKPEDFRYAGWRKQWGKHGWWRSLFQVYALQGVLQLGVALPLLLAFQSGPVSLGGFSAFSAGVAALGLMIETVADIQKAAFKRIPENRDRILMTGLWGYSRHPNYFGEAMFWWGIGLMSIEVPYGLFSLLSPVLMNWLLLNVSGVPLIESNWRNRPEFEQYRARTNRFFPGRK